MPSVVLITGVNRFLGRRLAARLSAAAHIDRVIGVDSGPPGSTAELGRTEFVRADIRNPLIATVLTEAGVDTVVHTPPARTRLGPAPDYVAGTMQLLAGCQRADSVERFVLSSTTAVYDTGPRAPAVHSEAMRTSGDRQGVELETLVRGFHRRRPDIAVSVLRLADLIGPTVDSPLTRYLTPPVVPTPIGFDPRLQLLHEDDAVEYLYRACTEQRSGVVNVAGAGALALSQVLRRAARLGVPASVRGSATPRFGAVVDTTRLLEEFGRLPHHSSAQALESFVAVHPGLPRLATAAVDSLRAIVDGQVSLSTLGTQGALGLIEAGRLR